MLLFGSELPRQIDAAIGHAVVPMEIGTAGKLPLVLFGEAANADAASGLQGNFVV